MTPFISELDNGLRVLLLESHSAPVATFWVWYGVGSRNEIPGWTGISHWVEHMLFKGTPTYPKGVLTRAIERLGGRWNAFTSWDVTAYHEVLPAEHLPFVIGLGADRMRHTLFEPGEVESERTVIISEREGAENFPTSHLSEEVNALAFKVHSYRHPVIGWKSDLRRMTRAHLSRHYRTYYHPRNALVVAVGAFDTPQVLPLIRQAFGDIDPGPEIPPVLPEEPPQEGERRVVVQRPGGATPYVQMAFRVPAAAHPDFPALMILDGALSGLGGARGGNAGGAARSSRLYRALVDRGLAAEAGSSLYPTRDPGLLRVGATGGAGGGGGPGGGGCPAGGRLEGGGGGDAGDVLACGRARADPARGAAAWSPAPDGGPPRQRHGRAAVVDHRRLALRRRSSRTGPLCGGHAAAGHAGTQRARTRRADGWSGGHAGDAAGSRGRRRGRPDAERGRLHLPSAGRGGAHPTLPSRRVGREGPRRNAHGPRR